MTEDIELWKKMNNGWKISIRGSLLIKCGLLELEMLLGNDNADLKNEVTLLNKIIKKLQKDINNINNDSINFIKDKLIELDAIRDDIVDLNALRFINKLEKLTIDNINISDLTPIYHLSSLKELVIKKSSIPKIQLEDFKRMNYNCKITFD